MESGGKNAVALAAVVMMMGFCGVCFGAVYKVGGSGEWAIKTPSYYAQWASSKKFHVGDYILFKYDNRSHSVAQVTNQSYALCNTSSPVATYKTGNDSILLNTALVYYFLCPTAGHCQAGQKFAVKVSRIAAAPSPASSPALTPPISPPSGSPPKTKAPAPSQSGAPLLRGSSGIWLSATLLVFFCCRLVH